MLISVNDRSYSSYRYFAERLAEALEQAGCQIGWCRVASGAGESGKAWQAALSEAVSFCPDAVIDFNSILPKMVVGGRCLPELFEAPFYHYVLDHPLYHKKALEAKIPDYRCICVDRVHEVYIKSNYPNITSVFTHPLPGSVGKNALKPFSERKNRVLFTGTYENPEKYMELMKGLPQTQKKECMELAQQLLDGTVRSMEGRVTPENAGYLFLADAYVRHYRRERCIKEFIRAGTALDIYGNGWSEMTMSGLRGADLQIHPSVMYSDYVNIIGDYRVALNLMPGFVWGSHDRITCAMRNGTAVLTDENPYVRDQYLASGSAVAFSWGCPERMGALAEQMLTDSAETECMACRGRNYADRHHSWESLAERILQE